MKVHYYIACLDEEDISKQIYAQAESEDSLPDRLLNIVEYGASNVSPECENTGEEDSHSSGEETAY